MTAPRGTPAHVDGELLREAMRRVPAAVTVVTVGGEEVRGITIGSFTSVSLDPPLIVFNVQRAARMHALLERADGYLVHVLREDQAWLSDRFADPARFGPRQFDGVPVGGGAGEPPRILGALATLSCSPHARFPAGDHSLFVGQVRSIEHDVDGMPVLYFDRSYRAVGEQVGERG